MASMFWARLVIIFASLTDDMGWFLLVLLLLVLFFVSIVMYVMIAPVYLEVNSFTGLLQLRFHRLLSARLLLRESLILSIRLLRWQWNIDLLKSGKQGQGVKQRAERNKGKRYRTIPFKKIMAMVKSIKVNKCYCSFDTGDMPTNAIIYPWTLMLSQQTGNTIMVNFIGENEVILELELRIYRLLFAFLKT